METERIPSGKKSLRVSGSVAVFIMSVLLVLGPCPDFSSLEWIFLSPEEMDQTETATYELPIHESQTAIAQTQTALPLTETQYATEHAELFALGSSVAQTSAVQATQIAKQRNQFYSDSLTQMAQAKTEEASRNLTLTAMAKPASHPPAITHIDFSSVMPADGTKVQSNIEFTDAGHDVNLVYSEVVQATLSFSPSSWDPSSDITYSGDYGIVTFKIWCIGQQSVILRFRLKDSLGTTSNPMDISFSCK